MVTADQRLVGGCAVEEGKARTFPLRVSAAAGPDIQESMPPVKSIVTNLALLFTIIKASQISYKTCTLCQVLEKVAWARQHLRPMV
jgi:hypothetical protein